MDKDILAVRRTTYSLFVSLGRAPSAGEVAEALGIGEPYVRERWQALHDAHALVLDAATGGIRMANPLSGVPTPYRVRAGGKDWFANCGWDAFGICAALHADGTIECECPDCGDLMRLEVRGGKSDLEGAVFHCLVPARAWWDDIVFT